MESLRKLKATDTIKHIIITRLTPERIPTLARVVSACKQPPEVLMASAALQMLREKAGEPASQPASGSALQPGSRWWWWWCLGGRRRVSSRWSWFGPAGELLSVSKGATTCCCLLMVVANVL